MAVMEEEDLDAVAEAWGGEDEDLIPGAPTEGLDEEMEGFEEAGANGDEDEEGGWDMEVNIMQLTQHSSLMSAMAASLCQMPTILSSFKHVLSSEQAEQMTSF